MTTQMPPQEPLDAQERELARILRALPGGEPPAALDASILRAATNAAAASRRPGARLFASAGALWGIGSAAAAVLAIGVAIQMQYSPGHRPAAESAPRAQAVSDLAEDEAVQVELGQDREQEANSDAPAAMAPPPAPLAQQPQPASRPSSPRRREQAPLTAGAPPPPPPSAIAEPEAFAADALDEHVGSAANVAATAEGRAGEEKDDRAAGSAAKATSAASAAELARERDARAASDSAASVGGLASQRADAPLKPANWITEIRRLRDDGQIEAARDKLVEFRRAYPQWVIPTDLAPLLSE